MIIISKTLFVIGHTFPEPTTTAAGTRMMQLLQLFQKEGYQITFGSTAANSSFSANLEAVDIKTVELQLNHASFDTLVRELKPQIVLFDRFITEEQFGWRVAEQCPDACRILDTEDLHFFRKAREEAVKSGNDASEADIHSETAKRELASILRCDLSLIISEKEIKLLVQELHIPEGLLYYLPMFADIPSEATKENLPTFDEREHFISIGNFKHAPNLDAVRLLQKEIWPKIRQQLPNVQLHIYGNYAPQQILQLHNSSQGFIIKGWAPQVDEVMRQSKVLLAPLRFGAGLKGKILDAMRLGTPTITTSIGAEGIPGKLDFGGVLTDSFEEMISASIQLYTNKTVWQEASESGFEIIQKRFDVHLFSEAFIAHIHEVLATLSSRRRQFFIGQILQQQTMQASKYLSKWIEEKNR